MEKKQELKNMYSEMKKGKMTTEAKKTFMSEMIKMFKEEKEAKKANRKPKA